MNKMQKARARMMIAHPFYATLVLNTPLVETTQLPTAAVDDRNMYYNPAFMESLDTANCVQFVFAHEVMHMTFNHVWRLGERDRELWNIACDYVINDMLLKSGMSAPRIKGQVIGLFDSRYTSNMSADEVYAKLLKEREQKRKQNGGGKPGDKPNDKPNDGGWGGDLRDPVDATPEAKARAETAARQRLAQATDVARRAGLLPGHLKELIDKALNPVLPWQEMLREYMTEIIHDDESWSRRNRRFADTVLPARHSERMGEIVFIGDTSGSIASDELAKVAAEVAYCADLVKPECVRLVWADTRVTSEQVFEEGEPIICKPTGGGGTDMRVPLKHVEKYEPSVVVLMTDGFTPWPTTPLPYPLIVCCTTNVDVPCGQTVRTSA